MFQSENITQFTSQPLREKCVPFNLCGPPKNEKGKNRKISQITKCVHSASVTARTGADYAARVRSPHHADASSYATHIAGTL